MCFDISSLGLSLSGQGSVFILCTATKELYIDFTCCGHENTSKWIVKLVWMRSKPGTKIWFNLEILNSIIKVYLPKTKQKAILS